jgi:hypothetical protein
MDPNAKSQAVERIKEAQNVLITVSTDPSVDQLAAAIGFTLLLNKLDKHATAVFSGAVPSTLEFLRPEETFEQTTDSLRDFIISLDKSKADKLRYKVEDDVVRIFITPYKTKLTDNDLQFSQGDYNVDVVVALGVDNKEHIDQAIVAHGRILHDATVVGVMAGGDPVDIGNINWQDPNASSLCEMLMSISESLQSGSLDNQIATAFLTGIVAKTDRFKNELTTPKVMTMSAQLMAAGANQQLIAAELTQPEPQEIVQEQPDDSNPPEQDVPDDEGVITLHHDNQSVHVDAPVVAVDDDDVHIDEHGEFSNADQLREAVEQVQSNSQNDQEQQDDRLPGEDSRPGETVSDEPELSLPSPEEPLPEVSDVRTDESREYVAPFTPENGENGQDDLPSIEQFNNRNYSKFMTEKPTVNAPLNAIDNGVQEEPVVDPLTVIPQAGPLAETEKVISTESPLLTTQHDAESPRALEVPTTPSPQLSDDGETQPSTSKPLGPEVSPNNTLSEIESSVENFESDSNQDDASSADAARQAVLDAINQADPSPYEPPKQNIGAQFVPLDTEPQLVDPALVDQAETPPQNVPPSVPPPLMPPFPIPGIEVVEPSNDTSQNKQ